MHELSCYLSEQLLSCSLVNLNEYSNKYMKIVAEILTFVP